MGGAAQRPYRSIGEVLALLQDEFPDVTISKIRFLEAQGLIEPERTPSGYRRFRDHDVHRLREVLALQRDEYLPLRVIRERLHRPPADAVEEPVRRADVPQLATSGAALRRDELIRATGVEPVVLDELLRYGLLHGRTVGGDVLFDESAVVVAKLAARFRELGLDARHLRTLKVGFDRERVLYDQLLLPLAMRPSERATARERRSRLVELGSQLRSALLADGPDQAGGSRA